MKINSHSLQSLLLNTSIMSAFTIFFSITCTLLYLLPVNMATTVYEHYTANGIQSGLSDKKSQFSLNGQDIIIYSGAVHYFRVHPKYWRDRLKKLRAIGLNTVETYVPWNLHQPEINKFDFGKGGSDFEEFLDIAEFIKIAKEEDLLVIIRPGPYICAEWDFGGLPSWLLRYRDMRVRTSDEKFLEFVDIYYKELFKILSPLQFMKGGPIIAFQIENEYGNTDNHKDPVDTQYLQKLKDIMIKNGVVELFFTSDTPSNGFSGTLPGVLATANFQDDPIGELTLLKNFQPKKPVMVMEYWTGWFDHWTEKHHKRSTFLFGQVLEEMLKMNASFNLYMFHGGTNWGFLNGANLKGKATDNEGYQPDTTSYDYDAPLLENGDYGDKYLRLKELMDLFSTSHITRRSLPNGGKRASYPLTKIDGQLDFNEILFQNDVKAIKNENVIAMEELNINNGSGQSYGYIVYRKSNLRIPANSILKIEGRVCDTLIVLVNGVLKSNILENESDFNEFGFWNAKDATLNLGNESFENATLDLIVENWGRVNYGQLNQFDQRKGLWQGNVLLNNEILKNYDIFPLQFKKSWINSLSNWQKPTFTDGPALYRAVLTIEEDPQDTYVYLRDWKKGIITVNGFVLSRYLRLGPQQCAFVPGPLLKKGDNVFILFEHYKPNKYIRFTTDMMYDPL